MSTISHIYDLSGQKFQYIIHKKFYRINKYEYINSIRTVQNLWNVTITYICGVSCGVASINCVAAGFRIGDDVFIFASLPEFGDNNGLWVVSSEPVRRANSPSLECLGVDMILRVAGSPFLAGGG